MLYQRRGDSFRMPDEQTREPALAAHRSQDEAEPTAKSALILDRLLAAHEAWFDISRDKQVAGRMFGGFAEFHSHGSQYVLVKRAKLWEAEEHEYILFDTVGHLTLSDVRENVAFMKEKAIALVHPEPNHMSSNLSLVVIATSADEDALAEVRKTRYRKNFALGFRGWSDLRLAVVDLSKPQGSRVVTNAAAKPMRETLEANASDALS